MSVQGHENVPLLSGQFCDNIAEKSADGRLKLLDNIQDARDTAQEIHKGSMKNVENALNQTIDKYPNTSFYILRCLRRDFKAFTTFHEIIQVRPMHAPVPQTPGMTLFHWNHENQELYLLWSLPVSQLLEQTLVKDKDDLLKNYVRDYLAHQAKNK